jgi:hypothetical protein
MDSLDFFEADVASLVAAETDALAALPAINQATAQAEKEKFCGKRHLALAARAYVADFDSWKFTDLKHSLPPR